MRKIIHCMIIIIAIFTGISDESLALPVSEQQASEIANNFFTYKQHRKNKSYTKNTSIRSSSIKSFHKRSVNNVPAFYIFNYSSGGWVIVSADNATIPVLGYSLSSELTETIDCPPLVSFLDNYATQIHEISLKKLDNKDTLSQWKRFQDIDQLLSPKMLRTKNDEVRPLTQHISWRQSYPYNKLCPVCTGSDDGHCPVGCVAVAMGIIMKFWNQPQEYQWEIIPDKLDYTSDTASINAVARLLADIGQSVGMDYGPEGSGAKMYKIPSALKSKFSYSSAQHVNRMFYKDEVWIKILKDQLKRGEPICYGGCNNKKRSSGGDAGHAFVCDGYDELDYFSFNWGWGTGYKTYFTINNLTPTEKYNFSYHNEIVVGIKPDHIVLPEPPNEIQCDRINLKKTKIQWQKSAFYFKVYKNDHDNPDTAEAISGWQRDLSFIDRNAGIDKPEYYYWIKSSFNSTGIPCSNFSKSTSIKHTFIEQSQLSLTGLTHSCGQFGDYDNDNDLDLILCGENNNSKRFTALYQNNNNQFIEQTHVNLPEIVFGSVEWCDLNSDNWLDIIFIGRDKYSNMTVGVYKNNRDNTFSEQINTGLDAHFDATIACSDIDNDGDLDVLITGKKNYAGDPSSIIYLNQGNFVFSKSDIHLPSVYNGSAAFGDYDADGDFDLILTGITGDHQTNICKLFDNDNGQLIENFSNIFPGINSSSVAFGDLDNDGHLDLIISGAMGATRYPVTKLYINRNNQFKEYPFAFHGIQNGSVQLADYTNNGYLDILITGESHDKQITTIYTNNGYFDDSRFTEQTDIFLPGVEDGFSLWADVDNDGDQDILISGDCNEEDNVISKIYLNNLSASNSPPSIPENVRATVHKKTVTISWDPAFDSETNVNALYYNAFIAREDQKIIWNATSNSENGYLKKTFLGNTQQSLSWSIHNLDDGKYYCRVQAFDPAFAASGFSDKLYFTIQAVNRQFVDKTPPSLPLLENGDAVFGDVNNDGLLDLLMTGHNGNQCITRLYKNNVNHSFSEVMKISSDGFCFAQATLKDFNNDNFLDVLLTGNGRTELFNNINGNTFEKQKTTLPGVYFGTSAASDFDNDGYCDVLLTGSTNRYASGAISKIYKNIDGQTFQEYFSFKGLYHSAADLGDYDNDGFKDIILSGLTKENSRLSMIYNNNSDGTFSQQNIELVNISDGSVKFGDYNNDGFLDILLTGMVIDYPVLTPVMLVYQNNGNHRFTMQEQSDFTAFASGKAQWGDFNNDGFLDIVASGSYDSQLSSPFTGVYINNKENHFFFLDNTLLKNIHHGALTFADYDNDGDNDIFLSGNDGAEIRTCLFQNTIQSPNTRPEKPSNLNVIKNGHSYVLMWDASSDHETLQKALTYNLRIGTEPGKSDILSPMAVIGGTLNGVRTIAEMGNLQFNTHFTPTDIPGDRPYYWSVQAVDSNFIGSEFSDEYTFCPVLSVSHNITEISSNAGTLTIAIQNLGSWEMDWHVYTYAPWVRIIKNASGVNSGMATLEFDDNLGGIRNAMIYISAPNTLYSPQIIHFEQSCVLSYPPEYIESNQSAICSGEKVELKIAGGLSGPSAKWKWFKDSCDGEFIGTGSTVSVSPLETTSYFVKAEGLCNTTSCTQKTIQVYPKIAADFSFEKGCEGDAIVFKNESAIDDNSALRCELNFGDGTSEVNDCSDFSHIFSEAGTFNCSLTVVSNNGCKRSTQQYVTIYPKAEAQLSYQGQASFCNGQRILLHAPSSPDYSYQWQRNNELIDAALSSSLEVQASGSYRVIIRNENQCDSISPPVNINVRSLPTAIISGGGTICQSEYADIKVELTGTPPWNLTYSNGKTIKTVKHIPTSPYVISTSESGIYQILDISDAFCSGSTDGHAEVIVNKPPVPADISISGPTVVCSGWGNFTNTYTGIFTNEVHSYQWQLLSSDAEIVGSSTDHKVNLRFPQKAPQHKTVILELTTANDCGETVITLPITLDTEPVLPGDITADAIHSGVTSLENAGSYINLNDFNIFTDFVVNCLEQEYRNGEARKMTCDESGYCSSTGKIYHYLAYQPGIQWLTWDEIMPKNKLYCDHIVKNYFHGNLEHLDCDGNGVIDISYPYRSLPAYDLKTPPRSDSEVIAYQISKNYRPDTAQALSNNTPIHIEKLSETIRDDQLETVFEITLGSEALPVTDLSSLNFELHLNKGKWRNNGFVFSYFSFSKLMFVQSHLGRQGYNMSAMYFSHPEYENIAFVAMQRTDLQCVTFKGDFLLRVTCFTPLEDNLAINSDDISIFNYNDFKNYSEPDSLTSNKVKGSIYYYTKGLKRQSANQSISNVRLHTDQNVFLTAISDDEGKYTLNNIKANKIKIKAVKTDQKKTGLNSVDVSLIAQSESRLQQLNCYQMIAADITEDGIVNSIDANKLARYLIGLDTCLNNNCNNWIFLSETMDNCENWKENLIHYNTSKEVNLDKSNTNQDFIAIKKGDVSGDFCNDSDKN